MPTRSRIWRSLLAYLTLILGAIIMAFPFLWMLSTSFKSIGAILSFPPKLLPDPFTFDNYRKLWIEVDFSRYALNSAFLVCVEVAGTLLSASIVAFGLAMFEFKGRKLLYMLMLATLMMPFQITMIPQFFIWKQFGALDSYFPLLVPCFFGTAFGIFLMHQNYKSLPKELYETSVVDGCNPLGMIFKIYIPLSKPALASLAVFTFIGSWNNTIGPLIYVKSKELYPLTMGLLTLANDPKNSYSQIMAGAAITMIPLIILFLAAQKYFIQGIASTGLKG